MGSRIRFTMAKQVFETFPELHEKVSSPEGDVSPQDYTLEILEGEDPFLAITYFAHILPKPEAVWWGIKCVEGLDREKSDHDREVLKLCENWVREGDEEARLAVVAMTEDARGDSGSLWIGRAVSWSGGSLSPNPDFRVDVPPGLTATALNAALQIVIGNLGPGEREEGLKSCLSSGLLFAEGGVMPVINLKKQAIA
ncbi:DUF6931 family protein [Roseibium album]|uniref:DUF6931 family protein n=1 Tax=Roseibium album TaxID=311410 RepID=UPI003BB10978